MSICVPTRIRHGGGFNSVFLSQRCRPLLAVPLHAHSEPAEVAEDGVAVQIHMYRYLRKVPQAAGVEVYLGID